MPERIYVNVNSDFDATGYMLPRSITWKDVQDRLGMLPRLVSEHQERDRLESVRDYRPASAFREGMPGDCYTVVIKGETRHLFFEKTGDLFSTRVGRWFVEKNDGA